MPWMFRRQPPPSTSTEPLFDSENSSARPIDAKIQSTSFSGRAKYESNKRKSRINDGDSPDPSTHQSDLRSSSGLPYRSTRINASGNIGITKGINESFIGSKDNPVSSLSPSNTHTRIATAEGEDDYADYTVTEGDGDGKKQIVDETTRITTELVNERIKRACGKLPKSVATGVLLSTPATRVLFASLSISENAGGSDEKPGTARTSGGSEMMANISGRRSKGKLRKSTKVTSSLAPIITEQLGFTVQMGKAKKDTVAGLKLASENGLVFKSQLQDKEYVFLNAAEFGEVEIVKELLIDPTLNVDCVDYMGRNAVLLAMKTENIELIDALVGKLNFYAVEDALLNAISQEKIHIVKLIIDHPQYIRMEKIMAPRGRRAGLIGKSIERSQFSADITPLMLAAHTNNHEIIQLLLDRGLTVEMPHDRSCMCLDCESIRAQDSLILEMQRLHTYQALTSSAYLALTTSDPVSSAFTLRGELYQLASQEKQFKEEYSRLAVQSMNFAVSCLDLCRTSDEVHSLLTANDIIPDGDTQYHLATIKHAVQCREKKFVAHSNCQHQLENTFYGNMFCIRDFEGWQRLQFFLIFTPLLPILYITYLFLPNLKVPMPQNLMFRQAITGKLQVAQLLRCPIIKFIGHIMSYLTFILLIAVATFRLDKDDEEVENPDQWKVRAHQIWSYDFRSSQQVMTKIQILLLFWIMGQLFGECKQVYHYGLRDYFRSYYNIMDWASVSLYLGAFALRIFVDLRVQATEKIFNYQLKYALTLLQNASSIISDGTDIFDANMEADPQHNYVAYRNQLLSNHTAYWLRGCRLWWAPDDPEYISDCLFALANVLSFARVSYLMPAWELLGPLQISLARMINDIIRFMALFFLMLIAFVVGLTNLYWYFSRMIVSVDTKNVAPSTTYATVRYASTVPAFRSSTATFHTLFWALFGMSSNNVTSVEEELASVYPGHEHLRVNNAAFMISSLGSVLYAIYNACMIIILLNMLIAMMSKSFDEIQGDRLEEWKFARANLWLVYIEHEGVLPTPLNLLPSRVAITKLVKRIHKALLSCRAKYSGRKKFVNYDGEECYEDRDDGDLKGADPNLLHMSNINSNKGGGGVSGKSPIAKKKKEEDFETHLTRVKCNIMRRYLFQLQKHKEAENKSGDLAMLNIQRQQQQQEFRATSLSPPSVTKDRASVIEGDQSEVPSAFVQRLEGVDIREPAEAPSNDSQATNKETSDKDSRLKEPQFPRTLAKGYTRGLSSLLMPPSVRRKLEAVAEVQKQTTSTVSVQEAEDAARYLVFESARRGNELSEALIFTQQKLVRPERGYDPGSFDSQFTARTERPLKHTHLRELYKVEQEMHDMSDALSSVSFTNSTMSEVDELEVLPYDST